MRDAGKLRLDLELVRRELARSRSRARDLVRLGHVRVAGALARKAGELVAPDVAIEVAPEACPYVSRGGVKLAAALDHFGLSCDGRVALDIGASTGGFTDVLLSRGARKVYALDVGTAQLHASLRSDPRVVSMEQTDSRDLAGEAIAEEITALTADVSFISLTLALPRPLSLAGPGAWLVALVKPQFEAGPRARGKRGIVGPGPRQAAADRVYAWIEGQAGWRVLGLVASPIAGKDGNAELLIGAVRDV